MRRIPLLLLVFPLALLLASCAGSQEPAPGEPVPTEKPTGPGGIAETAEAPADETAGGGSDGEPAAGTTAAAADARSAEKEGKDGAGGDEGLPAPAGPEIPSMAKSMERTGTRDGAASRGAARPAASGLKAAFADDNRQFNYFIGFLKTYGPQVRHLPIPVEERITLRVQDVGGRPLPNAAVTVRDPSGRALSRGLTYADGSFLFFPAMHGASSRYRVEITHGQLQRTLDLERDGRREVTVSFDRPRPVLTEIPLDLLFILDTTGSMGEEIERLKTTIEIINLNLSSLSSRPRVRFGLVLYRDRGDEYVTERVPFTEDLDAFQKVLNEVSADGGGDTPEDLQAALEVSVKEMAWNRGGVRLGFIITDAPPHLDYSQEYTYAHAAAEAKEQGIKLFSVGTGGLDLMGELILRQISQLTSAKYIFLTYGETGESEGGAPGSVSHHTGANFQTDKLEAIIIRLAREELAHVSDQPVETAEDYFEARKIRDEGREETLATLFSLAATQLIDYSSFRIPPGTRAAVLPFSPAQEGLALNAEYFTEQLILSVNRDEAVRRTFRFVERKDMQKILEELQLQLSDLAEDSSAARVGSLAGADLLLLGRLYGKAQGYELFIKLLRVETGEVLSVTKARIDRSLGL